MQYRTFETTGKEKLSKNCGILTVCWHTNGLMDVAQSWYHPSYLVIEDVMI